MKRSCVEIREMLVDYTDGQLSPVESNKVAEHLRKCEHCRETLKALQKSLELAGLIWADGLEETKEIRAPIQQKVRKIPWLRYTAVAAGILLVVTTSIVWRTLMKPAEKEISFAEIERRITESGTAARLLAATELLAEYTDDEAFVKQQYRHIIEVYPSTAAADKARSRI